MYKQQGSSIIDTYLFDSLIRRSIENFNKCKPLNGSYSVQMSEALILAFSQLKKEDSILIDNLKTLNVGHVHVEFPQVLVNTTNMQKIANFNYFLDNNPLLTDIFNFKFVSVKTKEEGTISALDNAIVKSKFKTNSPSITIGDDTCLLINTENLPDKLKDCMFPHAITKRFINELDIVELLFSSMSNRAKELYQECMSYLPDQSLISNSSMAVILLTSVMSDHLLNDQKCTMYTTLGASFSSGGKSRLIGTSIGTTDGYLMFNKSLSLKEAVHEIVNSFAYNAVLHPTTLGNKNLMSLHNLEKNRSLNENSATKDVFHYKALDSLFSNLLVYLCTTKLKDF